MHDVRRWCAERYFAKAPRQPWTSPQTAAITLLMSTASWFVWSRSFEFRLAGCVSWTRSSDVSVAERFASRRVYDVRPKEIVRDRAMSCSWSHVPMAQARARSNDMPCNGHDQPVCPPTCGARLDQIERLLRVPCFKRVLGLSTGRALAHGLLADIFGKPKKGQMHHIIGNAKTEKTYINQRHICRLKNFFFPRVNQVVISCGC